MKWGHLALALIIIQTLSACAGTNLSAMKQNLDAKQRKIIQDLTPLKIPVAKLGRVVILNKTGVAKYVASIQPSKIWWEFGPITNCNLISLYTWQADCLDEV